MCTTKGFGFCGSVVLGTSIALSAMSGASAQDVKLRASGHFPAGHTASIGMEILNSELGRLTKGQVAIDYFPGSQLEGPSRVWIRCVPGKSTSTSAVRNGSGASFPRSMSSICRFSRAVDKQAYCIIDTQLGEHLGKKSEEDGLVVLGWMSNGARHVTNNKHPLKSVDDLAGLKLRTPPSEVYLETFRALGANPTPIDIKELYQALQQGGGRRTGEPYGNIMVRKFDEVQKYLSNTGHFFSWAWVVMNKGSYEELSDSHKEALHEAAFRAVAAQRALAERENKALFRYLWSAVCNMTRFPPKSSTNSARQYVPSTMRRGKTSGARHSITP